jgi:hypothetical protein
MSATLQTVELPEDALALIREGAPKSLSSGKLSEEHRAPLSSAADQSKETRLKTDDDQAPGGFSNTSFRLPASLQQSLLRVSLERKLKRKKPWTQQDIAIEALELWLKKNASL